MSDRAFLVSFGISLGLHLLLLVGQLLSLDWFRVPLRRTAMDVIYDRAVEQEALRVLQERLANATRDAIASPAPHALGAQVQIRIPDRPLLTVGQDLSELMPDRASIVDLTNLVDAARGDPVLLSYFGAIREQIQRTANSQMWVSGEPGEGLIYVSFVLAPSGRLEGTSIVTERSRGEPALWDAALRILKTSAPFPPFPPSMAEPSKTIIVPLEFLVDS